MSISLYSGPLSQVDEHFVDKANLFADEHLKPCAERWEQTKQQPEPDVGSDATSIQTLATEKNDKYIINGSKAWVTNGVNADLLAVFTQTIPWSSAKGIAGFVIKSDMPGVSAKPAHSDDKSNNNQ